MSESKRHRKSESRGHSESAGQRVHRLANLGGMTVLAELEGFEKEVLLGGATKT